MNIQICATVSEELENSIKELAIKDSRTFSQEVSLLLQLAVKEKTRKRNAKKVHIEHNTADIHQNHS